MHKKNPLAVSSNIVVQELQGEVLVYDLDKNKALRLNESSAFIWKHCDGKKSVEDLTRLANDKFKTTFNEEFIELGLDELSKSSLISNYESVSKSTISRRKAILSMALPVAMLPVVTGILAPSSAHAASGLTCVANPAATCVDPNTDCNLGNTGADCPTQGCTYSCDTNNCCDFTLLVIE